MCLILLRQYLRFRDDYCALELDGAVLYRDRVVVPTSLRSIVLTTLHAAHRACRPWNDVPGRQYFGPA